MALALVAAILPVAASPASADTDPLYTEHGLALRLDETALNGPVLAEIETALQPFVDQVIWEGAATGSNRPFSSAYQVVVSSDLELSFEFINKGTTGFPEGGLSLRADIRDIEIEFKHDPWWPWADCSVWVNPYDASVDVAAKIDKDRLPLTPIELVDVSASWPGNPTPSSNGVCWYYIGVEWFVSTWNNIWSGSGPSIASQIETRIWDDAQVLIDDLWAEHVQPVIESLKDGYGISLNKLETDAHGLLVTADVDATGGVTIPGFGTLSAANFVDSGVDFDVDDLLDNRTSADGDSHVIVSIHPNVINQYLAAVWNPLGGQLGAPFVSGDIGDLLMSQLNQTALGIDPDGWSVSVTVAPSPAWHVKPTGTGGAPQLDLPTIIVRIRNEATGGTVLARFDGSATGIDLITEIRDTDGNWGPSLDPSGADVNLTFHVNGSHQAVRDFVPDPADIEPYVKEVIEDFSENFLSVVVTLAPLELTDDIEVQLCTTCGRYSGDERYTETFKVVSS